MPNKSKCTACLYHLSAKCAPELCPIEEYQSVRETEGGTLTETSDLAAIQNKLSPEEIRVILELRKVEWGKLTVIKKDGKVVMITPAPDILVKE